MFSGDLLVFFKSVGLSGSAVSICLRWSLGLSVQPVQIEVNDPESKPSTPQAEAHQSR